MNIDFSNPAVIAGVVAVALLIVVGVVELMRQSGERKRTLRLRERFGTEYDSVLRDTRNKRKAEAKLEARIERIDQLKIRELDSTERERYLAEWETVQARFVDHPRGAVTEADELIVSLLQARGFPVVGFEQRAADISVDHSRLVGPYRAAVAITGRAGRNEATTEELRTAMLHYRALFEDLLHVDAPMEHKVLVSNQTGTRLGVQH
jgi:hypothetical protein